MRISPRDFGQSHSAFERTNAMKEKLNKFLGRRNQTSLLLWLIVGCYLVYQAYQILSGDMGTANHLLLYIFSGLFIVAGLIIVAVSLYAFIGKHYQQPESSAESNDDTE